MLSKNSQNEFIFEIIRFALSSLEEVREAGRAESLDEGASARLTKVLEEGHRIIDGVAVYFDLMLTKTQSNFQSGVHIYLYHHE